MKYLHDAALADITALLSDCPVWSSSTTTTDGTHSAAANSRTLHGRLEAYTTKRAGSDKKLAVNVSGRYVAEQEAAVADDKLAALIHFQKDQLQHLTSNSNNSFNYVMTGRKRRSASTGEAPLELQKSRRALLSPQISDGRRGRANSLDIPRPTTTNDTTKANSGTSIVYEEIRTATSIPPQPNFRALSLAAVNRRLLTDLILTLNHSFPDYDFATAGIADFTVCSVQAAVTRINERLGEFSAATSTMNSSFLKSVTAGNGGNLYDGSSFLSTLWKAVDNVIHLSEVTEVYSYQPSNGEFDDPHSFLKHSLVKGGWDEYECDVVGGGGPNISAHRANQSHQYGGVVQGDDDVSEYDDDDDDLDDTYNKSRKTHGTAVHREVLWTFNYFFVNKHAKRILLFTCIETMTRSGYSIPPTTFNKFVHGIKPMKFNAIPEHEAVHHQLRNDTRATPASELKRKRSRRRLKYMRQSSPSILPSDDDVSDNENDDDDDDDDEYDGEEYDDDDSHTIASSSAVSVDFDLDPANAVSGGIPIGN